MIQGPEECVENRRHLSRAVTVLERKACDDGKKQHPAEEQSMGIEVIL